MYGVVDALTLKGENNNKTLLPSGLKVVDALTLKGENNTINYINKYIVVVDALTLKGENNIKRPFPIIMMGKGVFTSKEMDMHDT